MVFQQAGFTVSQEMSSASSSVTQQQWQTPGPLSVYCCLTLEVKLRLNCRKLEI